jgi:hypothetical protein
MLGSSGVVLDGSLFGGILFLVYFCTLLVKSLFGLEFLKSVAK